MRFFGQGHDPLMRNARGHAVQALGVGIHDAHARGEQFFAHVAHALVAARRIGIDDRDRFGRRAQTGAYGVKAR